MKRYFIVFYTVVFPEGAAMPIIGIETDGRYINYKATIEQLTEKLSNERDYYHKWEPVITNVLELSESDYADFFKE